MRDYKPKVLDILPDNVYKQVLYIVRDYDRMKSECDDMLGASSPSMGEIHGSGIGDPTCSTAISRELMLDKVKIIDECLKDIPEEYRKHIFNNIRYHQKYPSWADRSTWSRNKSRFVYSVAKKLYLV